MTDEGRKLRAPKQQGELFEYDLSYFDYDAPIVLVGTAASRANSPRRRAHTPSISESTTPGGPKHPLRLPLPRVTNPEPMPVENPEDPLKPSDFIGHHRRMERNEKRMQQLDLQQLMVDAEKVTAQREALLGPHWRREVGRIVKIDNPNDIYELETKRRLALAEMGLFLDRFERFKRRERDRDREREAARTPAPAPVTAKPLKSRPKNRSARLSQPAGKPAGNSNGSGLPSSSPEPLGGLTLRIPQTAFGHSVPPRRWRPCEFDIPRSWKKERKS